MTNRGRFPFDYPQPTSTLASSNFPTISRQIILPQATLVQENLIIDSTRLYITTDSFIYQFEIANLITETQALKPSLLNIVPNTLSVAPAFVASSQAYYLTTSFQFLKQPLTTSSYGNPTSQLYTFSHFHNFDIIIHPYLFVINCAVVSPSPSSCSLVAVHVDTGVATTILQTSFLGGTTFNLRGSYKTSTQ